MLRRANPLHFAPANRRIITEMTPSEKTGWLARLRSGLARTRDQLAGAFSGARVDEDLFDELESALILADVGMPAARLLLERLRARAARLKLLSLIHI